MIGRIARSRPNADRFLIRDLLNERMRAVLDRRPIWSGLIKSIVVNFPTAYITGSISVTPNSTIATGTSTSWPVSDVVNTTIKEQISASGAKWVTPASMSGITRDTVLYVDAGLNPEVLPVLDIVGTTILLNFQKAHNAEFSATSSSLSGLQLQVSGYTTPVYTVLAVTDSSTLVLNQSWGGPAQSQVGYQIVKMYITLDPYFKDVMAGSDPVQGIPLRLHVSQQEINQYDPDRTNSNSPTALVDRGPSLCGNFQHEVWPVVTTPYVLNFMIRVNWPDMRLMDDYPPPFLNPNVLIYGALADAFRTPCPRPPDYRDPYLNPQTAASYEALFDRAYIEAVNADESLSQQAFQWNYAQTMGAATMGSNWMVDHSIEALLQEF